LASCISFQILFGFRGGTIQTVGLTIAQAAAVLDLPHAAALSSIVIVITTILVFLMFKFADIARQVG
jgi:ABC-type spermidine/putrescine transport system permease subunit I